MLDLELLESKLASYELTARGIAHTYDPVALSWHFRVLDGQNDPLFIQERLIEICGLAECEPPISAYEAAVILQDFTAWAETHLDPILKNVFGAKLSSPTTTDSVPATPADVIDKTPPETPENSESTTAVAS